MNFETNFNETNETEKWKNQFILEQKLIDLEELIKAEEEKNEKIDDFSHKGNDRYYELVDEYNKIKEEIRESQPLTKKQKLIALDKLINERMEEIDREGIDLNYDGDEVYYGLVDKYNKLMEEVGAEEVSEEIPVPQPMVEEVKLEESNEDSVVVEQVEEIKEESIEEANTEEVSEEIPVSQPTVEEQPSEINEESVVIEQVEETKEESTEEVPLINTEVLKAMEEKATEEVKSRLEEMHKQTNAEAAELSPEKGSLFTRLKESFKNKENQKKALIFATALAVGTVVPYASMVYFGGGFFGIGAGASIPILKMIGIASKSAYLGGPLGGALIGLATKKILDFGFTKAENIEREMNEDEMEILIKNVEKTMKQVNIEDLDKNS